MKLEKRNYPLVLLEDLQLLLKELRIMINQNSDIVYNVKETVDLLFVREIGSGFYFKLYDPQINSNTISYAFWRMPQSYLSQDPYNGRMKKDEIISAFKDWIDILRAYNNINLEEESLREKEFIEYISPIFSEFTDNYKSEGFNLPELINLEEYHNNAIKYLKTSEHGISENDVKEIEESIQVLSDLSKTEKRDTYFKTIPKIWAYVKTKSPEACKFLLSEFVKILLKAGIILALHKISGGTLIGE